MKLPRDCRRFRSTRLASLDRSLSESVVKRQDEHLASCESCRAFDVSLHKSREALRNAASAPIVSTDFTPNLFVRLTGERLRRQLAAWRPALIGAVSAAVLLSTVVQLLTQSPELNQADPDNSAWDIPRGDARTPVFSVPPDSYDSPTRVDV